MTNSEADSLAADYGTELILSDEEARYITTDTQIIRKLKECN